MITINSYNLNDYETLETNSRPQLFENLDHDFLQIIFSNSILHNYKPDHMLIRQGDETSYVYLILNGSLKTLRTDKDGNEAVIRLLEKGDTCMEAAIFLGGPSPISVQVAKNTQLLLIPESLIRNQVLKNAQFATNLLKIVTKHYKTAMLQIDSISIKSPVQRVGYYLLEKHLNSNSDSLEFELPFKKSVIANHLGMTPETFSRSLAKIKKAGIKIDGEIISMRNYFNLCHFCDLDIAQTCHNSKKEGCRNYKS